MGFTEDDVIDRINGAKCMECQSVMNGPEVRDVIEELDFADVDEITDELYDVKSCSCDATMVPQIFSNEPVFGVPDVDNDYKISGRNGDPDTWSYDVDGDLLDRLAV